MGRKRKLSFDELIKQNRQEILKDKKELDKIEERIDKRINDSLSS